MERPTSKKTKEPPKEGKPQGEHQVPNNGLEPIVKGGGGRKNEKEKKRKVICITCNFGTKDAKIQPPKENTWGEGMGGGAQGIVLPRMIPSLVSSLSHCSCLMSLLFCLLCL